ncbi:heme-dependent oxidative N-demethylase subunit alpha family protein [Phenylobacterium sp. 58.2.17]|uniref:heme-dependent oxidative N-demethylase subunit alpha family protein n=1 Tax=Phenylobacterium sp. 58.2.17 TaxID=2969306 RepID=UPI002B257F1F|nr:heme-dependent oxidative N-demethylase subunit alpha family protein [Phenylobacterium sp. 58.2.17]
MRTAFVSLIALAGLATAAHAQPAPEAAAAPAAAPAAELFVRVERQTLRRLPRTGGALFTIRVWLSPLDDLAGDPPRLAAFARAWREATADFRAYKHLELYDELVAGFLHAHGLRTQPGEP